MSIDLNNPDNFPQYRPLLHTLAQLWTPPPGPPSTPPSTTTPAEVAATTAAITPTAPATLAAALRIARRIALTLSELQVQAVELTEYIEHLDLEHPENAPRPKRTPGLKRIIVVSPEVVRDRENLWVKYLTLKIAEVTGRVYHRARGESIPTSKAAFAENHRLNIREFVRWFAAVNGIPPGSGPDHRIRSALTRDIAAMQTAEFPLSHGSTSAVPIDTKPIPPHD